MEYIIPCAETAMETGRVRGSVRLFLVEDDAATREAVSEFLSGRGLSVRTFPSCEAFLEQPALPRSGCLLLDYHFPGMDGFQLLDALRARDATLSTILYTGRFNSHLKRRAGCRPEIVAFLQKPLGGQALLDALWKALPAGDGGQ